MVKLDVTLLRYLEKDDFRVLTAIEMGMRNHELVPRTLVYSIAGIQNGTVSKILMNLSKNQLVSYERGKRYDGYRLTYRGYDYLALNVLRNRGVISSIGQQIGVGKESDVYIGSNDDDGRQFAIKFHRLGRTCFRKVTDKRDYYRRRPNQNHKTASWIYLSRLAATREFAFMKLLYEKRSLPMPEPIDMNRHCIVMELVDGSILNQLYLNPTTTDDDQNDQLLKNQEEIQLLYDQIMSILIRLTNEFGVVHGDFNEFNIMIRRRKDQAGVLEPILIDFPQMISVRHELAEEYFRRDRDCIVDFFVKRFHYESDMVPVFEPWDDDQLSPTETSANELQTLVDAFENTNLIEFDQSKTCSDQNGDGKSELLSKFLAGLHMANDGDEQNFDHESDAMHAQNEIDEKNVMIQEQMARLAPLQPATDDSHINNDDDKHSIATTTFDARTIKSKLLKEQRKQQQRQRMKAASNVKKAVKGDSNAIRRRKRNDQQLAKEDLQALKLSAFD